MKQNRQFNIAMDMMEMLDYNGMKIGNQVAKIFHRPQKVYDPLEKQLKDYVINHPNYVINKLTYPAEGFNYESLFVIFDIEGDKTCTAKINMCSICAHEKFCSKLVCSPHYSSKGEDCETFDWNGNTDGKVEVKQ